MSQQAPFDWDNAIPLTSPTRALPDMTLGGVATGQLA